MQVLVTILRNYKTALRSVVLWVVSSPTLNVTFDYAHDPVWYRREWE
jgi:hypothetical protein